jgi:LacI family transcriptional regulator
MTHRFPIKEIARQAGLGTATVDRVLNERAHVSALTRSRVAAAICELEDQQGQLAARGRRLFVDIIVEAPVRFSREIRSAVEHVLPQISVGVFRPRFIFQEVMDDAEVAAAIRRVIKRGSQGVCLKARNTDMIRSAVADMISAGIPVVTLVTDLPGAGCFAYAGLDNANAGRTAAYLIGQLLPDEGTILTSRSHESFYGEAERFDAFAATLPARCKRIDLSGGAGLSLHTSPQLEHLLQDGQRIDAVYSMGGGNAAILDALEATGHAGLPFVAHDLDAENRRLLEAGKISFVLHHDLATDMRNAFQAIARHHRLLAQQDWAGPSDIQVVTPYNLPA